MSEYETGVIDERKAIVLFLGEQAKLYRDTHEVIETIGDVIIGLISQIEDGFHYQGPIDLMSK